MNGDNDKNHIDDSVNDDKQSDEVKSSDIPEDTVVMDIDSNDNVGDMSVEINVDELLAKIETDDSDEAVQKREAHRKLGEINERRRAAEDIDSTYNINLDDD